MCKNYDMHKKLKQHGSVLVLVCSPVIYILSNVSFPFLSTMGYTTSFLGSFEFSRPLTAEEQTYLSWFCATRRMKWDVAKLQAEFGGKHGNPFSPTPYGTEGAYFAFDNNQECYYHPAVLNANEPPAGQPGLWCGWTCNEEKLYWSGCEKFYNYTEWLQYIIDHFLAPWGVAIDGVVQWEGEDPTDLGVISVRHNHINVHYEECGSEECGSEECSSDTEN